MSPASPSDAERRSFCHINKYFLITIYTVLLRPYVQSPVIWPSELNIWAFCHPSWQQLIIVQIEPQNVWKYIISPQETSLPLMNICHIQSPVISRSEHPIKWTCGVTRNTPWTYGRNSTVYCILNVYSWLNSLNNRMHLFPFRGVNRN